MFIAARVNNKGFESMESVVEDILVNLGINQFPEKKVFFPPKIF